MKVTKLENMFDDDVVREATELGSVTEALRRCKFKELDDSQLLVLSSIIDSDTLGSLIGSKSLNSTTIYNITKCLNSAPDCVD